MNIVFDLGGVVVRWQPEEILAKTLIDPVTRELIRTQLLEHADWIALDRGTLTEAEAVARTAQRTGLPPDDVAAWLRQIPRELTLIPETVQLMDRLQAQGHTLFCLSNMSLASIAYLEQTYTFWEFFTGAVISCRLHLCKPEPAIYEHLLSQYALEATETVFIDDTQVNVTAAAQFGIQTIQFESPTQCDAALRALGLGR